MCILSDTVNFDVDVIFLQHGKLQRCCSDFCMAFVKNGQAAVWKGEKIALNIKNDKNRLTKAGKDDNIIKLSDTDGKRVRKKLKKL